MIDENLEEEKAQLNIHLDEKVAEGVYANLALVTHSATEFVLDFISLLPGMQRPTVRSRVVLVPEHAKRVLKALEENIEQYERHFGKINLNAGLPMMGMGGKQGEA